MSERSTSELRPAPLSTVRQHKVTLNILTPVPVFWRSTNYPACPGTGGVPATCDLSLPLSKPFQTREVGVRRKPSQALSSNSTANTGQKPLLITDVKRSATLVLQCLVCLHRFQSKSYQHNYRLSTKKPCSNHPDSKTEKKRKRKKVMFWVIFYL